jgi:hypothetical protein
VSDLDVWIAVPCCGMPLALLAVMFWTDYRRTRWLKRLMRDRPGESVETFLAACGPEVDPAVARYVYERVRVWINMPDFPLRPDDELYQQLTLNHEWFLDDAQSWLTPIGKHNVPELSDDVMTMRDLVRFAQACPPITKGDTP